MSGAIGTIAQQIVIMLTRIFIMEGVFVMENYGVLAVDKA
jgi:hypothetical protein